jgi:hypothetical protein
VSDLYSLSHRPLDLLRSRQNFLSGHTALAAKKAVENRFSFQMGVVILATPVEQYNHLLPSYISS